MPRLLYGTAVVCSLVRVGGYPVNAPGQPLPRISQSCKPNSRGLEAGCRLLWNKELAIQLSFHSSALCLDCQPKRSSSEEIYEKSKADVMAKTFVIL